MRGFFKDEAVIEKGQLESIRGESGGLGLLVDSQRDAKKIRGKERLALGWISLIRENPAALEDKPVGEPCSLGIVAA